MQTTFASLGNDRGSQDHHDQRRELLITRSQPVWLFEGCRNTVVNPRGHAGVQIELSSTIYA